MEWFNGVPASVVLEQSFEDDCYYLVTDRDTCE